MGIAFDLGSTTIVGYLCRLDTECPCFPYDECIIRSESRLNPQTVYGADILSRVSYASRGEDEKRALSDCLRNAVAETVFSLLSGESAYILKRLTLVGNPVIMGSIQKQELLSSLINADINKKAAISESLEIIMLPPVGRFVGADALAGAYLLECRRKIKKNILLLDIGTNGEVVLLTDKKKLAASAAAGPALEGGNISCGMRGTDGAVEAVSLTKTPAPNPDIILRVIGNIPPEGICGSGLLSLIQCMLEEKIIDSTGYLRSRDEAIEAGSPLKLSGRIVTDSSRNNTRNNVRYFRLTDKVRISQNDIHEVQLAVSALRCAVEILLSEAGLTYMDIDEVHLAGAFGNYITIESVLALGLLPPFPKEKIYMTP